jgi:hypothetical protein
MPQAGTIGAHSDQVKLADTLISVIRHLILGSVLIPVNSHQTVQESTLAIHFRFRSISVLRHGFGR